MKGRVAVALALVLLAGCDDAAPAVTATVTQPRLEWQECAGEVAVQMTTRHRCGTLTVPVDRESPGGPTLALGVVQVWPKGDDGALGVVASVGFNHGEGAQEPGLMALLAQRLGVSVVSVAPRGVGRAGGTPLDCPEADGLEGAHAMAADNVGRAAFLDAVRSCRARLVGQGVDPTRFGLDDVVADLEALRSTLAVERWHALVSYGEMARVSDLYAATHAARVRALVQDSPPARDRGPVRTAAEGMRSALQALFDECREDARCSSRYPDLERTWEAALDRVTAAPLTGVGPSGEVRVDAPRLLRAVRGMLGGDGPADVPDLPRVITAAADGKVHPSLADVVGRDPDHCTGYRPICPKPGFSLGAYLAQVCPEVVRDGAAPPTGDPVWDAVFGRHPYVEACEGWAPGTPTPAAPAGARPPTLVLTGHLDAWSRPEWFDGAVVVPGATHDVSGGFACVLPVRAAFLADPTALPDTTACEAVPFPAWD